MSSAGPGRLPTTKYGTEVPSSDVAKYCRTAIPAASKKAGSRLSGSRSGEPARPYQSVVGSVNPLVVSRYSSL